MTEVTQLNPFETFDNKPDLDISSLILPDVVGHNILVLPIKFEQKTRGGLILSTDTVDRMEDRITVGRVMKLGPMAYKHNPRFFGEPDTDKWRPWAKEGDYVLFSRLGAGTKITYNGVNYWVLTDNQVLATVPKPELTYPQFSFVGFETQD